MSSKSKGQQQASSSSAAPPPDKPKTARGHRQRGAGAVIADKGPRETKGGLVLKTWQKLPTQILHEHTQKNKRERPRYVGAKSFVPGVFRQKCILPDGKDREKDLIFCPWESRIGADSATMANEEAALLALHFLGPTLPLERMLPDPFRELWLATVQAADKSSAVLAEGAAPKKTATSNSMAAPLQNERWYTSNYERDQNQREREKTRAVKDNLRETKQKELFDRKFQPVYFSGKMRKECLAALRAEMGASAGGSGMNTFLLADYTKARAELEKSSKLLEDEEDDDDAITNRRDLMQHFILEVGFEEADVALAINQLTAVAYEKMLDEGLDPGEAVLELNRDDVREWLSLNVPEESLPENFRVRGQFGRVDFSAKAGGLLGKGPSLEELRKAALDTFVHQKVRGVLEGSGLEVAAVDSLLCSVELFAEACDEEGGSSSEEAFQGMVDVLGSEGVEGVEEELGAMWEGLKADLASARAAAGAAEEEGRRSRVGSSPDPSADNSSSASPEEEDVASTAPSSNFRYQRSQTWFPPLTAAQRQAGPQPPTTKTALLPAHKVRNEFLGMVEKTDVTLVLGQTGCGKSTQLPQFFGDSARVVCTQPRRLAALALARRVAQERGENDAGLGSSVGYCVRGDTAIDRKKCNLIYCTVGILLKKFLAGELDFTHLVIDEAHERSLDIDFLLTLASCHLKNGAGSGGEKPMFKLIVMSATMDEKIFNALFPTAAQLKIPGRTFPVTVRYAEEELGGEDEESSRRYYFTPADRPSSLGGHGGPAAPSAGGKKGSISPGRGGDHAPHHHRGPPTPSGPIDFPAVAAIVRKFLSGDFDEESKFSNGACLVFMPGVGEISRMCSELSDLRSPVLPLHGALSASEQRRCFETIPGKVVVATNVCETSITIPDVTCVVDTALERRVGLREASKEERGREAVAASKDGVRGDVGFGGKGGAGSSVDEEDAAVRSAIEASTIRMTELKEQFCSLASIEQRKGRAGRVQPGVCIRMIPRSWVEQQNVLLDQVPAEMRYLPLESMCLQLLAALQQGGTSEDAGQETGRGTRNAARKILLGRGPSSQSTAAPGSATSEKAPSEKDDMLLKDFKKIIACAPEMPEKEALSSAMSELLGIGAIAREQGRLRVTPLGQHLSRLPCDVRLGKLLVYSCMLGCGTEGAGLAAMLSVRNPLFRPKDFNQEILRTNFRRHFLRPGGTRSDHCFYAGLVDFAGRIPKNSATTRQRMRELNAKLDDPYPTDLGRFCRHLGVRYESIQEAESLKRSLLDALRGLGFLQEEKKDDAPRPWFMLRAACVAAFFLVKVKKPKPSYRKLASGAAIQQPDDPKSVRYFPLERDPFLDAGRGQQETWAVGASRGPRFFIPPAGVLFHDPPQTTYVCHTSLFAQRGKLSLESCSEAAPLAILLLGQLAATPEFRNDGTIVVEGGKLAFTTTSGVVAAKANKRGGGKGGGKGAAPTTGGGVNTVIAQLLKLLRFELQEKLLARKVAEPEWDVDSSGVLRAIKRLLATDGMG